MDSSLRNKWRQDGFVIVKEVFDPKRTNRLKSICEFILEQWRVCNPETGEPGGNSDATVMRHLNHSGYFEDSVSELTDLMDVVAANKVLEICRIILGEEPLFRCTSLFMNPTRTSQDGSWHRDTQFTTKTEREEEAKIQSAEDTGNSIQLQIALLANDDVEFVPGSHLRWDTTEEYHIRKADGGANSRSNTMSGSQRITLQPGDVLAFNPYGLHRGRYHTDKPRRTLMLTYTKISVPCSDYFSYQPWFLEEGYLGNLTSGTRLFFETFVSTYKPDWKTALN
ncbi:MAG: phytanoyl-CoA dioxygenase family protein [Candidatus Poribacteria bacterium]|nr:phytanoyl-CoA dioxygenase family protein [Candidatus Poribacteria bacterium]